MFFPWKHFRATETGEAFLKSSHDGKNRAFNNGYELGIITVL